MIEQTISAKLVAWFSTLIPAIVGAAISLKLSTENSSYWNRFISFVCGVAIAHYVGGAAVDYFDINIDSMLDDSIILASGIFGMATVTELSKEIPEIIQATSEKIKSWINR